MGKPSKVKVKPATALPQVDHIALGPDGDFWSEDGPATTPQRKEIERRKNAYPKLVALIRFLHEQTYTDAEGPELRAQNERTHKMTGELLRELGEES